MLSCYQCRIDCFIYKMFYVSFRITTKQKPTVDTQRIKTREPRHTSMERHEFTEAGKKDRRKEHGNHKKSGQQQGGISQHFVVVQSLSRVQLFQTPWTVARQASLSFTISQSLLKLTSVESMIPSNHLILCRPLLLLPSIFPSIRVFPMSQLFASGGQSIGVSASVLPKNIQDSFPLGLTGWISLQSKGLSRVFSSTTV